MKTMYQYRGWGMEIETVDVVKETASFITIRTKNGYSKTGYNDQRRGKDGFYDTWEQCHAAEIARRERAIDRLKDELQRERSALGQWQSMKAPA